MRLIDIYHGFINNSAGYLSHNLIDMKPSFIYNNEINFTAGSKNYSGNLAVPEEPALLIIFSHGFNSSRYSERNMKIAHFFNKRHIATLLVSLESVEEDLMMRDQSMRNMADHLHAITEWAAQYPLTSELPIVYFGEGAGADIALYAASIQKTIVRAIICCAGRLQQAIEMPDLVQLPVLLLVSHQDKNGIALNKLAVSHLENGKLKIMPKVSALFEERGELRKVADAAVKWLFKKDMLEKVFSPQQAEV